MDWAIFMGEDRRIVQYGSLGELPWTRERRAAAEKAGRPMLVVTRQQPAVLSHAGAMIEEAFSMRRQRPIGRHHSNVKARCTTIR